MANELKGKRVAFLFTEGVEQVELTEPLEAVRKAGADPELRRSVAAGRGRRGEGPDGYVLAEPSD
jgi:putative intracellular protease/amidase